MKTVCWKDLPAWDQNKYKASYVQSFQWRNLTLELSVVNGAKKRILENVSGRICPGETLAIMGTSGCGKTTFLDLLAGGWRRAMEDKKLTGSLYLNNRVPSQSDKRHIAFVSQKDIFLPTLTVGQTLNHAAMLRRPKQRTHEQQQDKLTEIATVLGLDECMNTSVVSVSGGQKRRLSVAMELLSDPSLLICDEPTSGLDSTNAAKLIQTFRTLADRGKSIICSIHGPSSQVFELFDKVMLLSQGRVVYYGHASQVTHYFASINFPCKVNWNPADFMLDVASDVNLRVKRVQKRDVQVVIVHTECAEEIKKEEAEQDSVPLIEMETVDELRSLCEWYDVVKADVLREEDERRHTVTLPSERLTEEVDELAPQQWSTSWWEQFTILLQRSFQQKKGEILTRDQALKMLSVAAIAGLVFFQLPLTVDHPQDRYNSLFFPISFWFLTTMMASVMTFPAERSVVQRERERMTYRLSAYFAAKSVSELPVQLIYPVLFVTLYYWLVGFSASVNFLVYLLCILLAIMCGDSLGLLFSNSIANVTQSIIWCSISTTVLLMFAGFYAKIRSMPIWIRWVNYIGFPRYIFAIVAQRELSGLVFKCDDEGDASTTCLVVKGDDILSESGLDEVSPWVCALIVIGMTIIFRLLAFRALNRVTRP